MSEQAPFTPSNMAQIVNAKHTTENGVAIKCGPQEGQIVERNGQRYQWQKVPSGATVYDPVTQLHVPHYHSLRTYFSHETPGIGAGPGWDSRSRLANMSDEEMIKRYGHIFSLEEISQPGSEPDFTTGEYKGGMPDDIPYLNLEPIESDGN